MKEFQQWLNDMPGFHLSAKDALKLLRQFTKRLSYLTNPV